MKEQLKKSKHILLALLFTLIFLGGSVANAHLGADCYTLDWITRNSLYLSAGFLCVIPTVLKKWKFGLSVLAGTVIGLICAEAFGSDPQGAALGLGHYGWFIWLCFFAVSIICGVILEIFCHKQNKA